MHRCEQSGGQHEPDDQGGNEDDHDDDDEDVDGDGGSDGDSDGVKRMLYNDIEDEEDEEGR